MRRSKQIFIVEDNEIYSMMLDFILSQNSPCRFTRFATGEECLASLYLDPDIIILDYGLPGMNGYETLLKIKEMKPHVRVLILTNQMDCELAAELRNAGADDYILKQGCGEELVMQRISAILEKSALNAVNKNEQNERALFEGFWGG